MSLLLSSVSFIVDPLINILSCPYFAYQYCKDPHFIENEVGSLIDQCLKGEKITPNIETKIKEFIKNTLNLSPDGIEFIKSDTAEYPCASMGTIEKGLLILSLKFLKEIEQEFGYKHMFAIAHEINHLMTKDTSGKLTLGLMKMPFKLVAYGVSALAITYFFGPSLITTHLVGCCAAKATDVCMDMLGYAPRAFTADYYAASQSPELASGGMEILNDAMQYNLKKSEEAILNIHITMDVICKIPFGIIFVSSDGENRFDFEHPPIKRRIEAIKSIPHEKQD
jgi:hypothetical protein